jgi:hypothetical protein
LRAKAARTGRVLRRAIEVLEERRMLSSYFVNMTGQTFEDVPGYMTDIGAAYGDRTDRGNAGVSYGWINSSTMAPVDNTANGRNRNSATVPANPQTPILELYDSFNHLQKQTPPYWWEIAIPNGVYNVHIASGDATAQDSRFQMQVEGVTAYDRTPTAANRWVEGTIAVNVTDGKLTVGTGPNATNAKLDFVEITSVDQPPTQAPVLQVTPESSKVTLGWTGVPNAPTYNLFRGTSPGTETLYQSALTGTSFTDTAVTPGTTYSYYVVPTSLLGNGPQSNELSYQVTAPYIHVNFQPITTTKPTPTGYLKDSGEAFGDRQNGYTYGWWNAPDNVTPAPTADGSSRERNVNPDARYDTIVQLHKAGESPPTGPVWWEVNIPNGTYKVRVVAGDASNADEYLSFIAEANKVGGVPQVDGSGVSLIHYDIPTLGGNFADSGFMTVTVTDGNLTISEGPDANNNKIAFIDIDTLTVLTRPADPTTLTISNVRASQLTLNWTDASDNETGFRIEQSTNGTTFTPMATAPAHTGTGPVSFLVAGLTPSTHYYYRVYAVNLQGDSTNPTNIADTTTTAVTGALTGRVATGVTGDVNLTTEGTADWAHWGSVNANTFEHKAGVTSQISDVTPVGASQKVQLTGSPTTFSWTDGTGTPSMTATANELGTFSWGHGFTFTVPADTAPRALRVYLGVSNLRGQILARLSDGSAPDYVDSTITSGALADGTYTLVYKAGSAGQTLSVTWIELPNNGDQVAGRLNLKAATLQVVQLPTGGATSIVATPLNSGRVKLSWTDSATNNVGYFVQRAPDVGGAPGTFTQVGQTNNPANTFIDSAGGANTKYYYRLVPYNIALDPGTPSGAVAATTVSGTFGDGALATYYDAPDLAGGNDPNLGTPWPTTSVDPTINFDFGNGAPTGAGAGFGADTFMVRWSAKVKPEFSGEYIFGADTDDGYRLWVNGNKVLDALGRRGGLGTIFETQPINLIAGQTYDIMFDMAENTGGAGARLYWSSAANGLNREIVPQVTMFHTNQDEVTPPTVAAIIVDGRLPFTVPPDPHMQVGVRFSENVAGFIDANDFMIQNLKPGGPTYGPADFNLFYDQTSDTAFIYFTTLPSGLPDGDYRLTVKADGVADNFNNLLDGDNNGTAGGDFVGDFFVYQGDVNHDRIIDFNDLVVLAQNYNTQNKVYADGDFNHDGNVDFNDLVILAQRYNKTLPPNAAPPVAGPAPAPAVTASVTTTSSVAPVVAAKSTSVKTAAKPVAPKKLAIPPAPPRKFATRRIAGAKDLLA